MSIIYNNIAVFYYQQCKYQNSIKKKSKVEIQTKQTDKSITASVIVYGKGMSNKKCSLLIDNPSSNYLPAKDFNFSSRATSSPSM